MLLPVLVFCCLFVLIFAVIAVVTRSGADETALERRLAESVVSESGRSFKSPMPAHLKPQARSRFSKVDALLAEKAITRWLQILIVQGQVGTTVGTFVVSATAAGLAAFGAVYLWSGMPGFAAAAAAVTFYAPVGWLQFKRSRRLSAFNAALPDCIEMCARSLRVGNSIVAALGMVAAEAVEPAKTEFAEVFQKQNYGLPLRDALMQMLDRVPSMDLQVLVTGILVQKDTGGNLAEILDRIVLVIRERMRIQREIRTHTAQGRLTGWILCLLPPVMLGAINLMNPGYSDVLFHEELGHKLLYAGAGLLLLGAFLIRQIVNGIEV